MVKGWQCPFCGHSWIPRKIGTPIECPRCKRHFTDNKQPIATEVAERKYIAPIHRFKVKVETAGSFPCRKCGQDTSEGFMVGKLYLCESCTIEYFKDLVSQGKRPMIVKGICTNCGRTTDELEIYEGKLICLVCLAKQRIAEPEELQL